MADRIVRLQFITYNDSDDVPRNAMQGEEVDTSTFGDGEEERLDSLGAFEDSPEVQEEDAVTAYLSDTDDVDRESGLEAEGPPPAEEDEELPEGYGDNRSGAEKAADLEEDSGADKSVASRQKAAPKEKAPAAKDTTD